MTAKKGSSNNGADKKESSPCPVDCKRLVLELDCSTYANHTTYPKPEYSHLLYGWEVNPHPRCDYLGDGKTKVKGTDPMQTAFFAAFSVKSNKTIPAAMQKWAKDSHGIDAKYGEELFNALKAKGLYPQMHHNLPIALKGRDDPSNYVPLPFNEHQKSAGGIHQWWDRELNEKGSEQLKEKLQHCKKNATDRQEKALHDCSHNQDGSPKSTCESKITRIAECFAKNPPNVTLYVKCQ